MVWGVKSERRHLQPAQSVGGGQSGRILTVENGIGGGPLVQLGCLLQLELLTLPA